jgi:hypothetical protein
MSKYLRRGDALASKHYAAIMARAMELLAQDGRFEKRRVIEDVGLAEFEDSVRWDYLKEFIEAGRKPSGDGRLIGQETADKIELVGMVSRFFHRSECLFMTKDGNRHAYTYDDPQKFFAIGYGKSSAGFASVRDLDGKLVLWKFGHLNGLKDKIIGHIKPLEDVIKARGLLMPPDGNCIAQQ